MKLLAVIGVTIFCGLSFGQSFYFGCDLSYANQMEDCGAVYKENNVPKDVYRIFADHGTNLVRVRLWYEPTWQNTLTQPDGVKPQYSDITDVKETIRRSKSAGMQVMLDVHLSDFWADPSHQIIPARWVGVATDTAALADSVYNYMVNLLTDLDQDTLMPEIVKIGNENNGGILRHTTLNSDYSAGGSVSTSWSRHARMYRAAIHAIRFISQNTEIKPKICLHYAGLDYIANWYQTLLNNGVTDFDIIGFSYYYAWHGASIAELGNTVRMLKETFPAYDVMAVETGYPWTTQDFDDMPNIVTEPDPEYLPVIPEKQLEYMVDYTRAVMYAGGIGVIFWEPAWVSTPCSTPWGQGSAQDHVAFFQPVTYNFIENGAGRWPESPLYSHPEYKKLTFKVSTENVEVPDKMYITGDMTGEPWTILPMLKTGTDLYSYVSYLPEGDSGAFYFLNDSSWEARESVPVECAEWWGTDRGYKMGTNDTVISHKWGTCLPIDAPEEVMVTFKVDMTDQDVSHGVWITGSWTGSNWSIIQMASDGNNIYKYYTLMHESDSGAYYFMNDNEWGSRETVPPACATWWGSDRGYKIGSSDTTFGYTWGTCLPLGSVTDISGFLSEPKILLYPNPSQKGNFNILINGIEGATVLRILDTCGQTLAIKTLENAQEVEFESGLPSGTYILTIRNNLVVFTKKLIVE
jgi:arabinogalactan endo-1,4-beta-galactosidase